MDIITLSKDNIEKEHICCAMSSKSTTEGVIAKKEWLSCRIQEGLIFKKLDAKGKVFIEYIPAENAWLPLDANGYMIINCFWVSGSFKGHGYGKQLLAECEADAKAKGCKGVAAIVGADKKRPYLTDGAFMKHYGYRLCDNCPPFFGLVVKTFDDETVLPRFKDCAKLGMGENIRGIDIFYTAQCPFTIPYVKLLTPVIMKSEYPVRVHQIKTKKHAQEHICPITTYSVFIDGKFYTNEILSSAKLEKLVCLSGK